MKPRFRTGPVVAACGVLTALGSFAPATSAQTPPRPVTKAATVRPERLDYQITMLPNGLKVVTLEDHRAPVVTVQVWYRVGSKDEAVGKAGFAHLFEHLMFKGSKNVASEEHAKFIEQIGGAYNADTSFDRTRYFETVPSNALDRVLFLEADRMTSLRVDAKNLASERDVVKEEHRLRVDNAPYGQLLENVQNLVYPDRHPYQHTTIGLMADLDSAKLADVRAFHDEYYKPDNATLVVVGDFRTADALAKIKRYFGPIPKSKKAFTRYPAANAPQAKEKRATFYDKLAPLPLVGMAYRLPAPTDPDAPVFDVISQILSAGQSSRLYRSLVRDKQIAVQAAGSGLTLKLGGVFFFFAVANAGKTPAEIEAALNEQASLLRTTPVSAAELAKAKNQVLTGEVFGNLSTEQKADSLGEADLLYGTPEEANRSLARIAAVTAADVQRVAKKYFSPERRNVFAMLPGGMKPKETK